MNNLLWPGPTTPWRFVLGLVTGIVIPGYVTTAALFPQPNKLDGVERWGLSLTLSVVWLLALALVYGVLKLRLTTASVSLGLLGLTGFWAALAVWQRGRMHAPPVPWPPQVGRAPLMVGALAVFLGLTTWWIVSTNLATRHVTLSLTDPHNHLSGYPFQIREGAQYPLTIHVDNPTPRARTFHLTMAVDGHVTRHYRVALAAHHTWEQGIFLPSQKPQPNEKVTFDLYGGTSPHPLRTVWVRYAVVSP